MAGLWRNNQALVAMLGLCPLLAVSNSVVNALGMGIATLFVLVMVNVAVASLRRFLLPTVRLVLLVVIIAFFVTLVELVLAAYAYTLYERLGIFVPLIVTNCILLGRAEAFASRATVPAAFWDGVFMGAGFLWVLVVLGAFRELFGQGTLFSGMEALLGPSFANSTITVADGGFLLLLMPPGAFIGLALMMAAKQYLDARLDARLQQRTKRKGQPTTP